MQPYHLDEHATVRAGLPAKVPGWMHDAARLLDQPSGSGMPAVSTCSEEMAKACASASGSIRNSSST